ncbi:sensor histidine kinase [Microlunatus sp. Gsoil 973]|uniref:sensor histidine kinase n=1 Tax=Microlunatus sp. Gsoil 973 TaxID=2672569 RepID=UPI0012B4F147|nr:histidine kinase [Microlunatus sp. Gsoil 973]QGN33995.1 sensor histidine kinase [Microlunatus sp. Gsoil 973]
MSGSVANGAGVSWSALDQILPSAEPPYPGWRRPSPGPTGFRADLIGAVALTVGAVITMPLYPWAGLMPPTRAPLWLELLWSGAVALPLAWRRRYPTIVAVAVSALYMAGGIAFGVSLFFPMIALFVAFYTLGAWESDRQRAWWTRMIIIAAMFIWLVISIFVYATGHHNDEPAVTGPFSPLVSLVLIQLLTNTTFFAVSYYLGNRGYAESIDQDALERRTIELARERERAAAQAVALERLQIARELHDVVAHHVSVMGVQASAARIAFDQNPDVARRSLSHVESSARTAVDELHRMLTTLRDPETCDHDHSFGQDAEVGATVGIRQLPALIGQSNATGLPTRLEIIGEPGDLPSVVDVNIYRIVQEALTNVRKHAGPHATADVRLRYYADEVEVEVTNSGAAPSRSVAVRSGLGQVGMRERVAASGGTIELGALARGGYLVRARMPRSDRASLVGTGN